MLGQMVQFTKDSGWTTKLTDLEHIFGKTAANTTDNGQIMTCRVMVYTSTQMVFGMMASI